LLKLMSVTKSSCLLINFIAIYSRLQTMIGIQEVILIILISLSLIYLVYKLIKKSKNHNCDDCGMSN
ncbi:MAG TPA: FeoB-associated Cys-rich membrane protein, partial [Vicingus sp.]|nr:FeoB-associated Cys-rich membrane protein [Vicingus sp.]